MLCPDTVREAFPDLSLPYAGGHIRGASSRPTAATLATSARRKCHSAVQARLLRLHHMKAVTWNSLEWYVKLPVPCRVDTSQSTYPCLLILSLWHRLNPQRVKQSTPHDEPLIFAVACQVISHDQPAHRMGHEVDTQRFFCFSVMR